MNRFAILEHDWPTRHWDLFLEADDHLRTWRLLDNPAKMGKIRAEVSAPHRKFYLQYEGPISNERGCVEALDRGTFQYLVNEADRIVVKLEGALFRRCFELIHRGDKLYFTWLSTEETTVEVARVDAPCEWPTTTS